MGCANVVASGCLSECVSGDGVHEFVGVDANAVLSVLYMCGRSCVVS